MEGNFLVIGTVKLKIVLNTNFSKTLEKDR